MRNSHQEQIERWAKFVHDNPTKWKAIHTKFINAIFQKRKDFEKRMLATHGGKEKLLKLQEMRKG